VSYRIEDRDNERGLLAIDPVRIDPQGRVRVEITEGSTGPETRGLKH
jgi:hypothetical protein